ncbi:MAG: lipocalin-like domain-containing protein, partial [Mangrovicoccus sp.]
MPDNPSFTRRRSLGLIAALATAPLRAQAQGFAGLGQDADGFALPAPNPSFTFPQDHGPHPDFRIEWWYITANMQTAEGREFGCQWTLFRSALLPEYRPGWASPQIWFAHAALTSADFHRVAERRARGGIGQAGAVSAPFSAWIDDWSMQSTAPASSDALSQLQLSASGEDWRYDLDLAADGPLVFHGDQGYSVKSERGQASYYYSQPHYQLTGQLRVDTTVEDVSGQAWLDREWSSQPLDADQTGWDWFSLHLESGDKLMVYRLRHKEAENHYIPGSWITSDGRIAPLENGEISLIPLRHTRIGSRRIPTQWQI